MTKIDLVVTVSVVAIAALAAQPAAAAQRVSRDAAADEAACARLTTWSKDKARVTRATLVNGFDQGDVDVMRDRAPSSARTTKRFCRIEFTVTPAPGAEIKSEVWLPPASVWNGRFLGTGNGGAAGRIVYPALVSGIERDYAVANTDVGTHSGGNGYADPGGFRFGYDSHDLRANYIYRGIHEMTAAGKQLTSEFYADAIKYAYFVGCSSGGQEGLAEVQRFPADYDGVVIGNPALRQDRVALWQGWSYSVTHREPAAMLTDAHIPVIAAEAMRQCDGVDGLKDGLIADPRRCRVDYTKLECRPGQKVGCLTPRQVQTVRTLYGPFRNPETGQEIYPAFRHGTELAAGSKVRLLGGSEGSMNNPTMPGPLGWIVGRNWTAEKWLDFDFAEGGDVLRAQFAPYAVENPDLRAFKERGGKLIMYHGWADPNLSAEDLLNYFLEAGRTTGQQDQFMRLFLVPGMYHCRGGPGPNSFGQDQLPDRRDPEHDIVAALDRWVTENKAPEVLIATKFQDDDKRQPVLRTRPICAYPKVARWNGRGSIDVAGTFTCEAPAPSAKPGT